MLSSGCVSQVVHTYSGSGSFGELALMYNMPRAASVRAQSPGALWAMDRHTFRRILLKSAFKKRKLYEELLDKVPMLKALQVCSITLRCFLYRKVYEVYMCKYVGFMIIYIKAGVVVLQ